MKVWENFKTISNFNLIKNKRKCWVICYECKKGWEEIETDNVHMITIKGGEARFICDTCLPTIKAK